MTNRLTEMADEVRRRAANPEHAWDKRALDWPLTKESTVVEVGGYTGRWALQIALKYAPRLFVFEPQPWAHAVAAHVLADSATVQNYALGNEDVEHGMGDWETDGCSFVKASGVGLVHFGLIREIGAAFERLGITDIDLMLMNIEGYEYTLLPHMIDQGILPKRLMMQWHLFGDPYGTIMAGHWERLERMGYRIAWTYGIMLTAWERN